LRALDKRAVDPARFETAALLRLGVSDPAPDAPQRPPQTLFFVFRETVEGPYPLAELSAMVRDGRIGPATQVHPQGEAWMPAARHPALAALFPPAPPRPEPPSEGTA
ncbi:GYF domain-containing protein, partial [Methylobacterium trifolii]